MRGRAVWAALVAVLACHGACGRACRPAVERVTLYDLAERLWLAERVSPRDVVLFGTPGAEPRAVEGFSWELDGSSWAWALPQAEVRFDWPTPAERVAVLELEPSPGNDAQRVQLALNGQGLGEIALEPTRARYRVGLPARAQRRGDNRLRLTFSQAAPLSAGGVQRYAARVSSVTVGAATDGALDGLMGRGAPGIFEARRGADPGGAAVTLTGPASVHYVLALPEAAELRFTPALHATTRGVGQALELRVTLEREGQREAELWRRTITPSDDLGEVGLSLPGRPGELAQVGLHVGGALQQRVAWGVFGAPRVSGVTRVGDPLPSPVAPEDEARGAKLRRSLAGANVLLVILDAARADHLGCYGYRRPTTPEIDRIAGEGVVFERAYTTSVNTLGAMSSIWTSQYPDAHHRGVVFLEPLPADRPTLAELLAGRGVTTFGAVANAMAGKVSGLERGFAEFREIFVDPGFGSRAEVFRKHAYDWFAAHRRERFFAYLHYREPHSPFDPPDSYMTLFGPNAPLTPEQRIGNRWFEAVNGGRVKPSPAEIDHLTRLYDGNLAYVDREVGALRAMLEREGLWEQTVVIVAADHGDQLYEEGYLGHSAQVRQESARVPLIVRFPAGKGPRGLRVPALVDHTDLAPTIADILGALAPGAAPTFQGRSLLPVIAGAPGKGGVLVRTVWERPVYALVAGERKLVYDTRTGRGRLFRLDRDPGERTDVSAAEPLAAAFLRQALHAWVARLCTASKGVSQQPVMTCEQCQNLLALGYLDDCSRSCP